MGPSSPMWIVGLPRSYLAGARSDRSGRWPSRVWMMNRPAARAASSTSLACGTALSSSEVSLPSDSPKPPGYTKSRWKSTMTSATVFGSNSKAYGSASKVIIRSSCYWVWSGLDASIQVPVSPRTARSRAAGVVMRASWPPRPMNVIADSIFGPMEPRGNSPSS